MTRKIALEEHFLVEGFANMGRSEGSGPAAAFRRQAAERLPEIDQPSRSRSIPQEDR